MGASLTDAFYFIILSCDWPTARADTTQTVNLTPSNTNFMFLLNDYFVQSSTCNMAMFRRVATSSQDLQNAASIVESDQSTTWCSSNIATGAQYQSDLTDLGVQFNLAPCLTGIKQTVTVHLKVSTFVGPAISLTLNECRRVQNMAAITLNQNPQATVAWPVSGTDNQNVIDLTTIFSQGNSQTGNYDQTFSTCYFESHSCTSFTDGSNFFIDNNMLQVKISAKDCFSSEQRKIVCQDACSNSVTSSLEIDITSKNCHMPAAFPSQPWIGQWQQPKIQTWFRTTQSPDETMKVDYFYQRDSDCTGYPSLSNCQVQKSNDNAATWTQLTQVSFAYDAAEMAKGLYAVTIADQGERREDNSCFDPSGNDNEKCRLVCENVFGDQFISNLAHLKIMDCLTETLSDNTAWDSTVVYTLTVYDTDASAQIELKNIFLKGRTDAYDSGLNDDALEGKHWCLEWHQAETVVESAGGCSQLEMVVTGTYETKLNIKANACSGGRHTYRFKVTDVNKQVFTSQQLQVEVKACDKTQSAVPGVRQFTHIIDGGSAPEYDMTVNEALLNCAIDPSSYTLIQEPANEFQFKAGAVGMVVELKQSFASTPGTYTFKVSAKTEDYTDADGTTKTGATGTSGLQSITVVFSCSLDVISLDTNMKIDDENLIMVDGVPRFNVTSESFVFLNVGSRIQNQRSDNCPLVQFEISKIETDTGYLLSEAEISSLGVLNGKFLTFNPKNEYAYYRVYIKAFNTERWGGDDLYVAQINTVPDEIIPEPEPILKEQVVTVELKEPITDTQVSKLITNNFAYEEYTFQGESYMQLNETDATNFAFIMQTDSFENKTDTAYLNLTSSDGIVQIWTIKVNITIYPQDVEDQEAQEAVDSFKAQISSFITSKFGSGTQSQLSVEEKRKIPDLKMSVSKISQTGGVSLNFNQETIVPDNSGQFPYDMLITCKIYSNIDGSIVVGKFAGTSTGRRLLNSGDDSDSLQYCEGNCAAKRKQFSYIVLSHEPNKISFQLLIDNKKTISQQGSKDQFIIQVNDPSLIVSALSGEELKTKNIIKTYCKDGARRESSASCASMPPQMDADEYESMVELSEQMGSGLMTTMSANIFLTMLFGFTAQSLFGLIRAMTYFVTIAMVEIPYTSGLMLFYSQLVTLLGLDFLQGPYWYEQIFEFGETSPFSEHFDSFEVGDMNFFMNSGSVPLLILIIIAQAVFFKLILLVSRARYHSQIWRVIGMKAEQNSKLVVPVGTVFVEGYIELLMAASLNTIAIYSLVDADSVQIWFQNTSDLTNSITSQVCMVIMILIPIWLTTLIIKYGKKLETDPKLKQMYGFMYESYDMKRSWARVFFVFGFYKRLAAIITLLVLDNKQVFQLPIFFTLQVIHLAFLLIDSNIHKKKSDRYFEMLNEFFVYTIILLNSTFLIQIEDDLVDEQYKEMAGDGIKNLLLLNFLLNILPVLLSVVYDSIAGIGTLYRSYQAFYKDKRTLERREQLAKLCPEQHNVNTYLQRQRAIEFCRAYKPHRDWAIRQGLDVSKLGVEARFLRELRIHDMYTKRLHAIDVQKFKGQLFEINEESQIQKVKTRYMEKKHRVMRAEMSYVRQQYQIQQEFDERQMLARVKEKLNDSRRNKNMQLAEVESRQEQQLKKEMRTNPREITMNRLFLDVEASYIHKKIDSQFEDVKPEGQRCDVFDNPIVKLTKAQKQLIEQNEDEPVCKPSHEVSFVDHVYGDPFVRVNLIQCHKNMQLRPRDYFESMDPRESYEPEQESDTSEESEEEKVPEFQSHDGLIDIKDSNLVDKNDDQVQDLQEKDQSNAQNEDQTQNQIEEIKTEDKQDQKKSNKIFDRKSQSRISKNLVFGIKQALLENQKLQDMKKLAYGSLDKNLSMSDIHTNELNLAQNGKQFAKVKQDEKEIQRLEMVSKLIKEEIEENSIDDLDGRDQIEALLSQESYDFVDDDLIDQYKQNKKKQAAIPVVNLTKRQDPAYKIHHADNLIIFTNNAPTLFNKQVNYSFLHAAFNVLLEFDELDHNLNQISLQEYKENEQNIAIMPAILNQFYVNARYRLNKKQTSFTEPVGCRLFTLTEVKQQLTCLKSSIKQWKPEHQPLPSEILMQIFKSLNLTFKEKDLVSDFEMTIKRYSYCRKCVKGEEMERSQFMTELFVDGATSFQGALDDYFGFNRALNSMVSSQLSNDYWCNSCKKTMSFKNRKEIYKSPKYMLISLNSLNKQERLQYMDSLTVDSQNCIDVYDQKEPFGYQPEQHSYLNYVKQNNSKFGTQDNGNFRVRDALDLPKYIDLSPYEDQSKYPILCDPIHNYKAPGNPILQKKLDLKVRDLRLQIQELKKRDKMDPIELAHGESRRKVEKNAIQETLKYSLELAHGVALPLATDVKKNRLVYQIKSIIDYDAESHNYVAYVEKYRNEHAWWYKLEDQKQPQRMQGLDTVLKQLKATHLVVYERIKKGKL